MRKLLERRVFICVASWARKLTAFWCATSPCTVMAFTVHTGWRTSQVPKAPRHSTANSTTSACVSAVMSLTSRGMGVVAMGWCGDQAGLSRAAVASTATHRSSYDMPVARADIGTSE
ncbi:hypothetical protein D9M68_962130 [compost metagenome]